MRYSTKIAAILTLLVVALLAITSRPAMAEARRIEITAQRFQYTPNEITLKKGEPVTLAFHSKDVAHGFKLAEFAVKAEIPKGGDSEVSFTPDKTGDFVAHCAHFCGKGHGEMTLTIHVVE